jgi:hypothetical protein
MSPEPNADRKHDFEKLFAAMRESRAEGSECVNQVMVHKWMWPELKGAVAEGLVSLVYTPYHIGRPGVYGMSTGDVFLDFNANRPQDGGVHYRGGQDPGAERLHKEHYERVKYRVTEERLEKFYELMEGEALPSDIVAFLGEENIV